MGVGVVLIPGRFDADPKRVLEMPNLFAPAGWAFAIWGVIFVGEFLGLVAMFFVKDKDCEDAIASSVPSWCAANLAQGLWCIAFRPWLLSQLWVAAVMLGTIAACLFASQQAMLKGLEPAVQKKAAITRIFVLFPRSLHLGWTTAASIVNVNSYAGELGVADGTALACVILSITLAAVVGLYYSASGLPTGAVAIAWGLQAVATGKPVASAGRDAATLFGHPTLEGLSYSQSAIAILLILSTGTVAFKTVFAVMKQNQARQSEPQPVDLQQQLASSEMQA